MTAEQQSDPAQMREPAPIIVHEFDDRDPSHTESEEVREVEEIAQDPNRPRERFIPVSRQDILERMSRPGLWGGETAKAKRFFRYLSAWRHISYNERLNRLEALYVPFSPEVDVVVANPVKAEHRDGQRHEFITHMDHLLRHANYTRVDKERLKELMTKDSVYGLDLIVDLDDYEECLVYWRGATIKTRKKRTLNSLYLKTKDESFPIYQRLFILIKLKPEATRIAEIMKAKGADHEKAQKIVKNGRKMLPDHITSDCIYVKLFKEIPRADLEMLFPNTRVKFRLRDKLVLGGSAGAGTAATIAGIVTKALAMTNPVTMIIPILGLGGVAYRQFSSFVNQRRLYMMVLAQNLYFHSLADNRGALTLLANRAEEEDIKEEVLLYTILAKEAVTRTELGDAKAAIESFLQEEFRVVVDFDIEDALERLVADGIVVAEPGGVLRALSLGEGIRHLDRLWDGYLNPDGEDMTLVAVEGS